LLDGTKLERYKNGMNGKTVIRLIKHNLNDRGL